MTLPNLGGLLLLGLAKVGLLVPLAGLPETGLDGAAMARQLVYYSIVKTVVGENCESAGNPILYNPAKSKVCSGPFRLGP